MAKHYDYFDGDNNEVIASVSNISFIEPIDDESEQSDSDSSVDVNAKYPIGNDNNISFKNGPEKNEGLFERVEKKYDYSNEKGQEKSKPSLTNIFHWESEGHPIETGPTGSQTINATVSNVSLITDSHTPQTQSQNNVAIETKVVPQHQSEEDDENYASDTASSFVGNSASSNDESQVEEAFVRNVKLRTSKAQSLASNQSSKNLNFNNNKKKKVQTERSSLGSTKNNISQESARDSDDSHALQRERFAKGRFRSVQLSSIRALSATKSGKSIDRNVAYGQRLVEKNGNSNVQIVNNDRLDLYSRYVIDIFTTLLDFHWTWVMLITTFVYIGHWIIFGLIYWAFAAHHQDDEIVNGNINGTPCVTNVHDFVSSFLFSMESETTIGYGSRAITSVCPWAVTCLTIQCIVSAIFDTWVIGLCFSHFARPDARIKTTLFSRTAVICKRDGRKCLLIRFANLRKSLLLNVTVRARLISVRCAQTREVSDGYQKILEQREVTFHNERCALLTAPVEYCHYIDEDSPFYGIHPDLFNSKDGKNYFELVFVVTGTLEPTGLTMHAQTSFLSSEIMYGYRFLPVVRKCYKTGRYVVDFEDFHKTAPESTCNKSKENIIKNQTLDVPSALVEETEYELTVTSTIDDVFTSDMTPQAESVL